MSPSCQPPSPLNRSVEAIRKFTTAAPAGVYRSSGSATAYRFTNRGKPTSVPVFAHGLNLLSALYANQRLPLPLRGVLLVGYYLSWTT